MEFTGKIIHILEPRSGVSARTGNTWFSQTFVIEETTGQYPRRCAFDVFGEEKVREFNLQIGQSYTVSIDLDAREYQGRWFNSVRAWRVTAPVTVDAPVPTAVPAPQAAPAAPAPTAMDYSASSYGQQVAPAAPASEAVSETDDLPF